MLEQRVEKQRLIDRHNEFMRAVQTLRAQLINLSRTELVSMELIMHFAPGVKTEDERLWLQREVEASLSNRRRIRFKVDLFVEGDHPEIIRIEVSNPPLLEEVKSLLFFSEDFRKE